MACSEGNHHKSLEQDAKSSASERILEVCVKGVPNGRMQLNAKHKVPVARRGHAAADPSS